jgi:DnaJ-class molecular chaperone
VRKTVTIETRTICTLCGGRGTETGRLPYQTAQTAVTCRGCNGERLILTKTSTRHEDFNLDELVEAVIEKMKYTE